jgi:hypothetical protein
MGTGQNRYRHLFLTVIVITVLCGILNAQVGDLYKKPKGAATRWASFENPGGEKEKGALLNKGAKGNAFESLDAGASKILLDVKGSGMITRLWFTVNDRTTETLRMLKLDMYWDGAKTPAVSVPFGDFFCAMLEDPVKFESALFANPEGRSFNCYIPMPFRKSARIAITNESQKKLGLLFYDIDYILGMKHKKDVCYFHAAWRREAPTQLKRDFEILPKVRGSGRFLGAVLGININPIYIGWWGEGEVKMYMDGDAEHPTIVGTGTEDYIGTGWGQGQYSQMYQGCLVSNEKKKRYVFYRFHVPDPVYFSKDIRVTIQQIGGSSKTDVMKMRKENIPLVPVSVAWGTEFVGLLDLDPPVELENHPCPDAAWTNYFRQDDVCAAAYFYLDRPENGLPPLPPAEERIKNIY